MADPKYAGLPGIASDQPDLYESTGEPQQEEEVDVNAEIGLLKEGVVAEEGLHLESLGWLGDLELVQGGDKSKESLVQRYTRIRCEVQELAEELDQMAESEREEKKVEGLNLQVETLRRQLEGAELEGESQQGTGVRQPAEKVEQLARDLEKLCGKEASVKPGEGGDSKETEGGVYQLYLGGRGGSMAEGGSSLSLAGMDARLSELEGWMGRGQSSAKQRVLSSNTDGLPLAEVAGVLAGTRPLLTRSHISHMEGRLASLAYKVGAISEQREALAAARTQDKLCRLERLVEGQQGMATVLPDINRRLDTVQSLAEKSKSWNTSCDWVEQGQANTGKVVEETRGQLADTRNLFETELKRVAAQFTELQKTLKTIKV